MIAGIFPSLAPTLTAPKGLAICIAMFRDSTSLFEKWIIESIMRNDSIQSNIGPNLCEALHQTTKLRITLDRHESN